MRENKKKNVKDTCRRLVVGWFTGLFFFFLNPFFFFNIFFSLILTTTEVCPLYAQCGLRACVYIYTFISVWTYVSNSNSNLIYGIYIACVRAYTFIYTYNVCIKMAYMLYWIYAHWQSVDRLIRGSLSFFLPRALFLKFIYVIIFLFFIPPWISRGVHLQRADTHYARKHTHASV